MLKQLFSKLFQSETRIATRHPISSCTQCIVIFPKFPEKLPVYLGDISSTGLSFYSKNSWFRMHDPIEILLIKDARFIELKGPIVSQRILFANGGDDLRNAIYRYSIQFSSTLKSEWVERFSEAPMKAEP